MTAPFGDVPVTLVREVEPVPAAEDVRRVGDHLAALTHASEGTLLLSPAAPTAAFSRRDTLLPGYRAACAAAARHGFEPMVRPVGGHLAAYDGGSLVVHLVVPHPDPRAQIRERFTLFGEALAASLRWLGVDARVGPVPGEYCDGAYSINHAGRAKLVGTGQRIVRAGFLFSAVVMVRLPEPPREVLRDAYAELRLAFRPETVGCVTDAVAGATWTAVEGSVLAALGEALGRTLGGTAPALRLPAPLSATA